MDDYVNMVCKFIRTIIVIYFRTEIANMERNTAQIFGQNILRVVSTSYLIGGGELAASLLGGKGGHTGGEHCYNIVELRKIYLSARE